jgi:hypothetical protein
LRGRYFPRLSPAGQFLSPATASIDRAREYRPRYRPHRYTLFCRSFVLVKRLRSMRAIFSAAVEVVLRGEFLKRKVAKGREAALLSTHHVALLPPTEKRTGRSHATDAWVSALAFLSEIGPFSTGWPLFGTEQEANLLHLMYECLIQNLTLSQVPLRSESYGEGRRLRSR